MFTFPRGRALTQPIGCHATYRYNYPWIPIEQKIQIDARHSIIMFLRYSTSTYNIKSIFRKWGVERYVTFSQQLFDSKKSWQMTSVVKTLES